MLCHPLKADGVKHASGRFRGIKFPTKLLENQQTYPAATVQNSRLFFNFDVHKPPMP
jgi:hypothetical protein